MFFGCWVRKTYCSKSWTDNRSFFVPVRSGPVQVQSKNVGLDHFGLDCTLSVRTFPRYTSKPCIDSASFHTSGWSKFMLVSSLRNEDVERYLVLIAAGNTSRKWLGATWFERKVKLPQRPRLWSRPTPARGGYSRMWSRVRPSRAGLSFFGHRLDTG